MTVATSPTVEQAITHLAATSAFADYDVDFGHRLAEAIGNGGTLTVKQRRAAHRMLRRYAGVLAEAGIDYAAIPEAGPDDGGPQAIPKDAVSVTVEDGKLVLRTPFKYKDVCKGIPGARWDKERKAWTYGASHTAAASVREAFSATKLYTDSAFDELLAKAGTLAESAVHKSATELPPIPITATNAWLHQRQAFWFAKPLPAAMLAMDMGTGKSKVAVDLIVNNGARTVLVQAPMSVVGVWQREFRIHAGADVHVLTLDKSIGSVTARRDAADQALHECRCSKPHILVINYEAARLEPFRTWALEQDWDYVIFDESHRIKSYNAIGSKFCARLAKKAKHRLALTGTPMGQSPLDVFGQFRALDPDIFGLSFKAFQKRYAIMGGYGGYEVLGYQRLDELNQRFYSIGYRVDADVLDLPDHLDVTRSCQLGSAAAGLYRQLRDQLYTEVEESSITAANVLVKLLRLQQITGGAVNDDDGNTREVDTAKADLLEDVLSDIDTTEPVVVFTRFTHDLDVVKRIAEKTGRRYGEISGRRKDLTADAHMPDDVDIMGVNMQSGGVGIDLTRSRYAIYYSLGFSLTDYLQSRRRVLRPGQEREVLFLHLVTQGTVDQDVYEALARNEEVVSFVLNEAGLGGMIEEENP